MSFKNNFDYQNTFVGHYETGDVQVSSKNIRGTSLFLLLFNAMPKKLITYILFDPLLYNYFKSTMVIIATTI